jgi:hypothetical protein
MSQEEKWILVVQYGDPNSHEPLTTSFGLFDTPEEANRFRKETYKDSNFIINIYPINLLSKESDS